MVLMGIELGQLFPFFIFAFHYFLLYYLSFNAPEPTQRSACIVLVSRRCPFTSLTKIWHERNPIKSRETCVV